MSDFEKLARDGLAGALAKGEGPQALADETCRLISKAARAAGADPKPAVVATARGALTAVALSGGDVAHAAVLTLAGLSNVSLMMRAGPEELMSWVMEGAAGAAKLAGPEARDKMAAAIEERFMGAGEVFAKLCESA